VRAARIALVGDFQPEVTAHQGIERSMALASQSSAGVSWEWIHTASIGADWRKKLEGFGGIWLVPASPYANESGALAAITMARRGRIPFLGTCGGFQHVILEFAREVLGLAQAGHAETQPDTPLPMIAPLACSLVEQRGVVHFTAGSQVATIYAARSAEEGYHCRYGLNPTYETILSDGGLRVSARDDAGEVRAVELPRHPFFIATLFQPERSALAGRLHPLVRAFIEASKLNQTDRESQ
jgi:CTP synthase (UTP-ammonia lyase)